MSGVVVDPKEPGSGWTRPEALAVAALLLVLLSGTGWLVWDRLGGGAEPAAGALSAQGAMAGKGVRGEANPAAEADGAGGTAASGTGAGDEAGGKGDGPAAAIAVHVAGAVVHPGVYRLTAGARVQDALTAAGGQRADGRADLLNLAMVLVDADKVYVPSQHEVDAAGGQAGGGPAGTSVGWGLSGEGKVDVNHADAVALQRLPGVGPSLAAAILRYRQEHGSFQKVEDLEKVPGIGPAKLAALRDEVVLR